MKIHFQIFFDNKPEFLFKNIYGNKVEIMIKENYIIIKSFYNIW